MEDNGMIHRKDI